jgi:hypothetical protein
MRGHNGFAGTVGGMKHRERDPEELPKAFRASTSGLYQAAAKRGYFVSRQGAERYLIADTRGHIIAENVACEQAHEACRA